VTVHESTTRRRKTIPWQKVVLPRAVEIIATYDTPVTLRQLFYRLVSEQAIPNDENAYKVLSRESATWRREGRMSGLLDQTRRIEVDRGFQSPAHALDYLLAVYTRDRTEGQKYALYLICEKRGMAMQFRTWFGDAMSIPVVCLGGFASQTLVDTIERDVGADGRPAVFLYAGDFDADGMEIERDFLRRLQCWVETWTRVVLTSAQVDEYRLSENPGKEKSPNAARFEEEFGTNIQVELDALDPADLRQIFEDAIEPFWNDDVYESTLARETEERTQLERLA
jgi:hypothetical protein